MWVGNTVQVLENVQVNMQKIVSRGEKRQGSTFQDFKYIFLPS